MDPAPVHAPSSTINRDLHCATCGYNLRTLQRGGLCPECGSPVADSLHSWLAGRDRRWLRLMGWGLCLLFPVPLLLILQIFIGFLPEAGHLWLSVSAAAVSTGLWLLGCRDRNAKESDRTLIPRLLLRLCAIVLLVYFMTQHSVFGFGREWFYSLFIRSLDTASELIRIYVPYSILATCYICVFLILARIAARLPNRRLLILARASLTLTACPLLLVCSSAWISWMPDSLTISSLIFALLAVSLANILFGRFAQIFFQAAKPD